MVKVTGMKRAERILLITGMLVLSAGAAHASIFKHGKSAKPAEAPQTAAAAGMSLNAVEIESSPSPRLLLRTSGTPAYTSYSPAPEVFVVDLTGTAKAAGLAIPTPLPPTINSVSAEEVVEMGTRLTRVTVRLTQPMTPQAAADGNAVVVALPVAPESYVAVAPKVDDVPVVASVASVPLPTPEVTAAPAEPVAVANAVAETAKPVVAEPAVTSEPIAAAAPSVPLAKAKTLKKVETAGSGADMEVQIAGDGAISYKTFRLENPSRVVVDLNGVRNTMTKNTIALTDPLVKSIRVSQFKGMPDPVTRVVMDLNSKSEYNVRVDGNRLRVTFGDTASRMAKAAPAAAPAATTVEVVEAPKPRVAPKSEPPVETAKVVIPNDVPVAAPVAEPVKTQPVTKTAAADIPSQVPAIAENAATWKMPDRASRGAKGVINAPADQAPPTPAPRATTRRRKPSAGSPAAAAAGTNDDVFSDAAAPAPSATAAQTLGGSRNLGAGERQYTGEPLSLNLKDADLKDVIRTFSQLTGLNIAVDPGVGGSVTVNFTDVPWDQALEIILRQNGLTYTIEGNVMRVGTIGQLANETAANRRLQEEERLNVPLSTVSFKLSYARATDVAGLLGSLASPRAKIIVDGRTNQLIISEIPQYLQVMSRLIDNVDVPTRQVVIEARIVETSKSFLQQYGVTWGFRGRLDPALGTGTGLVFPNRVDFVGGPFDFGPGNPIISTHIGNVLGTFNLDLALNAAEAEGLVKVISAPRVTTQDNIPASISSGFQIPYQTRINFTTTVSYIDATLRLSVTPQITEAGTVIMDISVSKTDPATGLAIQGGAGTPLSTRQATTKLMVRDGGTSVIAGIYQTTDNNSQTRLPFVHQIPIIGNLFKTHNISTSHDELLIFITPRIVRAS